MGGSLFGQQGQRQLGAVLPQKMLVHTGLGGMTHGGIGLVQRGGHLGHCAAEQTADAVLNDKVGAGAWRATGGQPAYIASNRLMPKISFSLRFTKASQV